MKFRLLLATSGNGWLGSRLTGTSSGRTCVSKKFATQARWAALRSAWLRINRPSRCSAGISSSLKSAYCSSISSCATAASAVTAALAPEALACSMTSASRTSKNSSRFDETIVR